MPTIFVYGTLKNPKLFQAITGMQFPDVEEAWAYGKMYFYEGYPVAFPDEEKKIWGYIMDIPYEILQTLDAYEEEGRLFIRKTISVYTETEEVEAEIYWGNPLHPGFQNIDENFDMIEDGRWEADIEEIDFLLK
jgi:gamma-glutamylcyclotransferase (GGCT)/AIG2-like uncharacterized protein YtfP